MLDMLWKTKDKKDFTVYTPESGVFSGKLSTPIKFTISCEHVFIFYV